VVGVSVIVLSGVSCSLVSGSPTGVVSMASESDMAEQRSRAREQQQLVSYSRTGTVYRARGMQDQS